MLNTQQKIKFSEHAVLYDILIPKDNKYRLIDELIDFRFIFDELKDKYCHNNGRTPQLRVSKSGPGAPDC